MSQPQLLKATFEVTNSVFCGIITQVSEYWSCKLWINCQNVRVLSLQKIAFLVPWGTEKSRLIRQDSVLPEGKLGLFDSVTKYCLYMHLKADSRQFVLQLLSQFRCAVSTQATRIVEHVSRCFCCSHCCTKSRPDFYFVQRLLHQQQNNTKRSEAYSFQSMLHCAMIRASYVTTKLRDKLLEKLPCNGAL